jgi:outer membrane receptor protein involved in Fe transport
MSIEDLMEIPIVVSASRQAQKMTELSVPVSVITAEDIRHSGLTSIPQILQFACGIDMLQLHRNTYAVGVRGLNGVISDRVKLLVNGRLADNAAFGGPEFYSLPVFVEDIVRIEIVRGPSGAVWGANAFTGIINIITKKPEEVLGYFGSTTINEYGDSYTHLRWAEKKGKWSWRASAGYEDLESSDDAIDGTADQRSYFPDLNGLMGFGDFTTRDFSRNWRFDIEAFYRPSEMTEISFGSGYSHMEMGDYEQLGYFPMNDGRNELLQPFARIDHEFDNGGAGHLQWFGNFWNGNWTQFAQHRSMQNDLEAQYNFPRIGRHQLSVGGNFQWTHINTHQDTLQQFRYPGEPFDEYMAGLFAVDRYEATDRLTIEGQIRADWYSETTTDWAGRLTGLYALDEQKNHILRLGSAKAFRTPLIALRNVRGQRLPVGGGFYALNLHLPTEDLENEETWSLEAGYTGRLAKGVTLRADTYYQRFNKLIGHVKTFDLFGIAHYTPDNIDGADSWGTELELAWEGKNRRVSAWYAYNDFAVDQGHQSVRSYLPAKHKVGLTGRINLSQGWAFNANYKFTNTTPGNPSSDFPIGSSHRLDLTVSKEIIKGNCEILFGVADLLNRTHDPIKGNSTMTGHEVPGRTFFGQIKLHF